MRVLKSILLIEDEPDIREIAKLALEAIGGYQVHTAPDGTEGLVMTQTLLPDLILLDVMMPYMDGPATLATLKQTESTRDIPVIFMTAKAQSTEIEQLLSLGAVDVVAKPFDPMTLANRIQEIWDRIHG